MLIILAGAIVVWLVACLFVLALCIVAKQGDGMTIEPETNAALRPMPGTARAVTPSSGANAAARGPLHLV